MNPKNCTVTGNHQRENGMCVLCGGIESAHYSMRYLKELVVLPTKWKAEIASMEEGEIKKLDGMTVKKNVEAFG